ncbi:hypothetical protein FHL15_005165 [Xylaria flabelliformis]|uniref:AB hydrolase-1 domain-containing protein n=1 Tax=Xylaria flabelliformis TaxID=2512241 RepID=A0A553I1N6_9PEZI|nr:hypothetical protein FHL15_005165 [Xylaria flabelliformis]
MTILEIALPKLKSDPALIEEMKALAPPFVANLQKAGVMNGLRGFFGTENGRDIRNEFREILLLQWPTAQHFKDFVASPGYLEFAAKLKEKFAAGPAELKLFESGSEVSQLFGQGAEGETVVEYVMVKPKDASEAGVDSVLQKLQSGLSQLGSAKAAAVRKSSNLDTQEIALVSLYASDAEFEAAKASEARKQLLADIANTADLTSLVAHVEQKYPTMTQSQPPEQLKGFESLSPGTYDTPGGGVLSYSHTPASQHKSGTPILVLLHGWPQTRYIWRYAVPMLSKMGYTLFVPDLPGYGYSTMSKVSASDVGAKSEHDRVSPASSQGPESFFPWASNMNSSVNIYSVGYGVLSAVRAVYGGGDNGDELKVVLIGHDRGGRVTQRLVTSSSGSPLPVPQSLNIRVLGAMLLDIVPYSAQWSAHANPRASSRYWHWTFLPSAFSVPMVQSYGGGRFCRELLTASVGSSEAGRESFFADGAGEHYARCYERDEVIRGAAADYSSGAAEDWDAQQEDIKEGRKMQVPVVVLYSEGLDKMHDGNVEAIWKQWTSSDANLHVYAMQSGVGHYIPEEAPEATNKHIVSFLEGLGL